MDAEQKTMSVVDSESYIAEQKLMIEKLNNVIVHRDLSLSERNKELGRMLNDLLDTRARVALSERDYGILAQEYKSLEKNLAIMTEQHGRVNTELRSKVAQIIQLTGRFEHQASIADNAALFFGMWLAGFTLPDWLDIEMIPVEGKIAKLPKHNLVSKYISGNHGKVQMLNFEYFNHIGLNLLFLSKQALMITDERLHNSVIERTNHVLRAFRIWHKECCDRVEAANKAAMEKPAESE